MTNMTHEEALVILEPFYNLFRTEKRDWDKAFASLHDDWRAYYSNDGYRDKAATRVFLSNFFELIPDINVEIKQLAIEGDVIAVRSELTGTPKDFFMVPHSGKSFRIMTIDFNRVKDGKLIELYHAEDWASAIEQLRVNEDKPGN
jgi:predicted ester cyclase